MKLPVLVVLVLLLIPAAAAALNSPLDPPSWLNLSRSGVIALCPNPVGRDDSEWFIVGNSSTEVSLTKSNRVLWKFEVRGPAVVTRNVSAFERDFPEIYRLKTSLNIKILEKKIILPNYGGVLRSNFSRFSYCRAKSGEIFYRKDGWRVRFQDWTDFRPVKANASYTILETPSSYMFTAKNAVIVSYTYTKPVNVENLTLYLDSHPIGGIPEAEARLLSNARAYLLKSSTYGFFHYKFAVAGNRTVLTTENWKWNKRGYIVEIQSEKVAELLRRVVTHDSMYAVPFNASDSKAGKTRSERTAEVAGRAWKVNSFSSRGEITVFVMPDINPVLKTIESTRKRLYIEAPYIKPYPRLLRAILKAAKRTRVLVVTSERCSELERLENVSERIYPFSLHGKLVVSDDKAIVITANLDRYGMEKNREVGVIFRGKACEWLAENFLEDYRSSGTSSVAWTFSLLSAMLAPVLLSAYARLRK